MRHIILAAGLAGLAACAGRADPGSPAADAQVRVLVVNESTDVLRVRAEGTATLRLGPGQRGCLGLRSGGGDVVLVAAPVGAKPEDTPYGQPRLTSLRSRSFNPREAPAWEWRLDGTTSTAATSLRPTETPCGA